MAKLKKWEKKRRNKKKKDYLKTRITNKNMTGYVLSLCMWALRNNKTDPWGAERLERFVDDVNQIYTDIQNGYLNILDISKQLEEETGIQIKILGVTEDGYGE